MTGYDRYKTWKQGFPLGTDEDTAIKTALADWAQHQRAEGRTPGAASARVVHTPEHTKAGEFLVRVDGEVS